MSATFSKADYTVVNVGEEERPRLITCVKASQGFDWNQEIFLPSYAEYHSEDLERRQDPVQEIFVSDEEVHRVVAYLKSQGEPDYIEGVLEGGTVDSDGDLSGEGGDGEKDPMYDQAVEVVLKNRKASISLVQRHLKIGYNRAARLVEDMEKAGLVSAMSGAGQREILVPARAE